MQIVRTSMYTMYIPWPTSPLGLSWKLSTRAAKVHLAATTRATFLRTSCTCAYTCMYVYTIKHDNIWKSGTCGQWEDNSKGNSSQTLQPTMVSATTALLCIASKSTQWKAKRTHRRSALHHIRVEYESSMREDGSWREPSQSPFLCSQHLWQNRNLCWSNQRTKHSFLGGSCSVYIHMYTTYSA